MASDLNNLSDEVLYYSNDRFYQFIEDCLGFDEMTILKAQAIKTTRALINVPDVLAVLDLKCRELLDIKKRLCFITDDNEFVVKPGIKAGIDDLIFLLKEKTNERLKKVKRMNVSSQIAANRISSINRSSTIVERVTTPNPQSIQSSNVMPGALLTNDRHIQNITVAIERFSSKIFSEIILKNNVDYWIFLDSYDLIIDGHIKCDCHVSIKIYFRSNTNSFQLSSYFKHLKNSRCSMVKKKKQALTNKTSGLLPDLSIKSGKPIEESFETEDVIDEIDVDTDAESETSSITMNRSTIRNSVSIEKKRSSSTARPNVVKRIRNGKTKSSGIDVFH